METRWFDVTLLLALLALCIIVIHLLMRLTILHRLRFGWS